MRREHLRPHQPGAPGATKTLRRFRRFNEFWPFYVRAHQMLWNRRLHFIGTGIGFICFFAAAITENFWLIPTGVAIGYGFAWAGHFFIERNKPATFKYMAYSLIADFKMFYLMLNGKMNVEIQRLQLLQTNTQTNAGKETTRE